MSSRRQAATRLNSLTEEGSFFTPDTPRYDFAVLYSGGLDSGGALVQGVLDRLAEDRNAPVRVLCLSFDYGQVKRKGETLGGKRLAARIHAVLPNVTIDLERFELPLYKPLFNRFHMKKPYVFYGERADVGGAVFPMRNPIISALGLAYCQVLQIPELHIGVGYSGSGRKSNMIWDTSMFAVMAMQQIADVQIASVASTSTTFTDDNRIASVRLVSPMYGQLKSTWTREVEKEAMRFTQGRLSLAFSFSCRDADDHHCGKCGACVDRYVAFPRWREAEMRRRSAFKTPAHVKK